MYLLSRLSILGRTTKPKSVRMAAPPSTIQSSDSRDSITTRQTVFTEATDVFYDAKSRFDSASIASGYSRGSKISLTEGQHMGRKKSQKKRKKSEEISVYSQLGKQN